MRAKLVLLVCVLISFNSFSQPNTKDSVSYTKERVLFHTSSAAVYVGTFALLNQVWYAQYERAPFHFFNDSKEWLQIDKAGHAQTAYFLTANLLYPAYRKLGYTKKQALLGASIGSWMYQATIEVLDGYSAAWGASVYDLAANTLGVALATTQQALWDEQRILLKYSTSTVNYESNDPILNNRVENLYGSSLAEKLFKDYNGTTFWLSANIASFMPEETSFPAWLMVSGGYGAQGMLGGFKNTWGSDGVTYDYNEVERYRQYYLSVDIDFTKIPIKGKAWSVIAPILNIFKLPAPTFEFNKFGTKAHWIYF